MEVKLTLHVRQEGRCAGCGERLPAKPRHCDLVHLTALGMGRSRWDANDPLNQLDNLRLMHRPCHEQQELERRKEHAEWLRSSSPSTKPPSESE